MTAIKYGVISDLHEDPRIVVPAIEILKKEGAEKLLVNGDIGGHYGSLEKSQRYTAFILEQIGKSELESFVQPGSHETLLGFEPVIEAFAGNDGGRYSSIVNCLNQRNVEHNGHDLVFLPGSDFTCGGEYVIGSQEGISSGRYIQIKEGLMQFRELGQYVEALNREIAQGAMQYLNMNDLRKLADNPEKTVVVCHVPRKFESLERCVDMAEFGEAVLDFQCNGKLIERGSVYPLPVAEKMAEAGLPISIKKENRGNEDLRKLYEELGVKKSVTGHFHESVHRANDMRGVHVPEGEMVDELFWNASYLDGLKAGILEVDGEKVSYRNIDLRDYISN